MSLLISILGAAALLLAGLLLLKTILNVQQLKMPGITLKFPTLPIFGPLCHPIFRDFQKTYYMMGEYTDKYGVSLDGGSKKDVMRMTMWWLKNNVIVQNADVVKQICVKKAKNYSKFERQYEAFNFFGKNILSSEGEEWRRHRTLCNPAFNDENLKHLCTESVNTVNQLIARYEAAMNKSGMKELTIDTYADTTLITFDIIGKAGFGYDLKIWESKSDEFDKSKHTMSFKQALDIAASDNLFMRTRYWNWVQKLPIPSFKRNREAVAETEKYIQEIIELRKGSQEQKYDLLSLLLSSKDGEMGNFTDQEVLADAFIFLLAGHETTSTQLSWTLYRLAKHPEIQEKLRNEVDSVLQGRDPTYEDYKTLRYLNCVVKESLRIHPPVARVFKQTNEEEVIGSYVVPAKTGITINVYAIHHDERYWEDPWEFRPERFDTQLNPKGHNTFAFIPFSIGNRNCIGQHFSLIESCMMLAKLIQNYTVHFLPGTPAHYMPKTVSAVTVRPDELYLLLKKRN